MITAGPAIYAYAALYELTAYHFWWLVTLKWLMLSALMLLPAITFGATIPALLSQAEQANPNAEEHSEEVSRESGALLFISSLANVLGFLLMVFVLHRLLDYGVQLLIVGGISALALIVYCKAKLRHLIPASLVVLAMFIWQHNKWDEDLLFLSYTNFRDVQELKNERADFSFPDRYKGYQDVFSINWMNGKPYFFINGYISIPLNNPSEKMVGALSSLYAPRLDDALVLGLGSGATASSVGLFFKRTEVVEINPVVRENLFRMAQWNFDIEHNPRVDIVVDDAIHHVKVGEKKYSMILNTVTTPLYFSSSKLYTRDFFDSIEKRLTPDGVYITWVDSRIGDTGTDIILRSLKQSFDHCAILYVKSAYFLLIASNEPLHVQQAEAVTGNEELKADLMTKHDVMAQWLPYHLLNTNVFSLIDKPDGTLNTADFPALEFEMARRHGSGLTEFKNRMRAAFDIEQVRQGLGHVGDAFPADYLAQSEDRLGNSSITQSWKSLLTHTPDFADKAKQAELDRRMLRAGVENSAGAWHAVGTQLTRMKRYEDAIGIFNKVLEMNPAHDNANYNLGTCYERLDQPDKALHAFRAEKTLDPKDTDVDFRIGRIYLRSGEYQKALDTLNTHIDMVQPASSKPYIFRAMAHKALGHTAAAKTDMEHALGLKDEDKKVYDQIGL